MAYERLDKTGLQYLLGKLKIQIEASIPLDMTGATAESAGTHGQVPAPSAGDQAKFLRGDGTWANTPYPNVFTGADGTNAGAVGLVPAPAAADDTKYLKGDGTWAAIILPEVPVKSVKVNGVALTPDAQGAVDVTVPTKVSDITNDLNFQTDTEVQDAIDTALTSTYKAGGSKTFAELAGLNVAANEGKVYDISDAFTTTSDFVEGAGKSYPAGTNVAVINVGTESAPSYKFDVMAGFIDQSLFVTHAESVAITNNEIDTIWNAVFSA